METKVRSIKGWRMLFALVLAAAINAPRTRLPPRPAPRWWRPSTGVARSGNASPLAAGIHHWGRGSSSIQAALQPVGPSTALTSTATRRALRATSGAKLLAGLETSHGVVSLTVVGKGRRHSRRPSSGRRRSSLRIQKFGGAGWVAGRLCEIGGSSSAHELLTSGQIVIRYA